MPEDDRPPLFFDTTACLFSDHGKQIDYVGVGRSMSNGKGLTHKPHAVVSLNSSVEPSTNLLSPAGGTPVVAGDSILVNLKKVSMWSGFTLCATLFTPGACLCDTTDVYYTVKKPNAKVPLAILAVKVDNSEHNSCIVMMIRKVKVNAEVTWELVRIGETLAQQDVKGVVKALQNRGLEDPKKYFLDPSHRLEVMDEYSTDGNNSVDDYYDDDDEVETRLDVSVSSRDCNFDELLANVPRVAREGRRQYNIGRSMLNPFLEGDSSDDDEVMEDALRAVVPSYTDASPVRYDDKTYNVGSSSVKLTRHYVDHREEYGLSNAGSSVKETPLPSLLLASLGELQRLSLGRSPFIRPTVPRELSSILPMVHRRKTCASWKLERSLRSARSSSRGRSRKKKKGRRGGSKKRSSRSPSSKRRRSKKKKGKRTPSPQLEAPDTDLGLVTPRLLSLPSE
ncbi:hypothetical protein TRVL_05048 [Trypanosoma vivax]|nr:hypothetical protein TRVL_05048 [Trypanosoma vivax]